MLPGLALTLLLGSPPPSPPGEFSTLPPDPGAYRRRAHGFAAGIGISCVLMAAGVAMIGGSLASDADDPGLLYAGIGLTPAAVGSLVAFSVLYARNERLRPKAQATLVPGGFVLRF